MHKGWGKQPLSQKLSFYKFGPPDNAEFSSVAEENISLKHELCVLKSVGQTDKRDKSGKGHKHRLKSRSWFHELQNNGGLAVDFIFLNG